MTAIDGGVVVESSSLSRDDSSNIADKLVIERSTHQNGLRERGSRVESLHAGVELDTRAGSNTVKSFIPPPVVWKTETRDRDWTTRASTDGDLLGQGHETSQDSSSLERS
jgi:hypothetical protein